MTCDGLVFWCRMIGRSFKSRAVVTSLVQRLRHGTSAGDLVLSHRNGVSVCLQCQSAARWQTASQQMLYCSNVVDSPHPELTVLRKEPPSVPHFVIDTLKKFSKQTALVGWLPHIIRHTYK